MELPRDEFDKYVEKAIDLIEPIFRVYLDEIPVVVEDVPSKEICRRLGMPDQGHLLGLFQGISLIRQVNGRGGVNQITLYRRNILAICDSRKKLSEQIRKTIVHELGHHLGFTEQQLHEHGY